MCVKGVGGFGKTVRAEKMGETETYKGRVLTEKREESLSRGKG